MNYLLIALAFYFLINGAVHKIAMSKLSEEEKGWSVDIVALLFGFPLFVAVLLYTAFN